MAAGDIVILEQGTYAGRGSRTYNVAMGATAIYAGEPVQHTLGATSVFAGSPNTPSVGTHHFAGIALTNSTQTATANGTVNVLPISMETTYLIKPKTSTSWDTQTEYNDLVGKRVLLDLTSGTYTILATDNVNNGCVIMPLDIAKYPGMVAFAFRNGVSSLS